MRRFAVLTLLLVAVVVAEIAVFALAARFIGVLWTLLLVAVTSLAGAVALRRVGVRAWRRFRAAVAAGRAPGVEATDGVLGLTGAVLLLVPGLLTDVVGALLVLPPTRRLARLGAQRVAEHHLPSGLVGELFGPRTVRLRRRDTTAAAQSHRHHGDGGSDEPPPPVIEGEIVD